MGMDARFYIGGFTEPARRHRDVIKVAEMLGRGSEHGMYVSLSDKKESLPLIDDGYCVIESLARAYSPAYKLKRVAQMRLLRELFPGRPIYLLDDYIERKDAVRELVENPSRYKDLSPKSERKFV